MNFGVRLGPFRVSTSGKGKVYGGVNAGPFSASGRIGGGGKPYVPISARTVACSLDDALASVTEDGWRVVARAPHAATIRRGRWSQRYIREIPGGVQIERTFTPLAVLFTVAAFIGLCVAWVLVGTR